MSTLSKSVRECYTQYLKQYYFNPVLTQNRVMHVEISIVNSFMVLQQLTIVNRNFLAPNLLLLPDFVIVQGINNVGYA